MLGLGFLDIHPPNGIAIDPWPYVRTPGFWVFLVPSGKLTWLLKMAIEIVDLPIKNGDFPVGYVNVYQRVLSRLPFPQPSRVADRW